MENQSFTELLKQLGSKKPTPGGGAAAAWVGALGSALAEMSMRYSIRKKTPETDRKEIETLIKQSLIIVNDFLKSANEDAAAYEILNQLQKLDADDPKRIAGWEDAVKQAIAVPNRVVETTLTTLEKYQSFMTRCNRWLLSDLAIAAILCESAARSAAWNIRINLPLIDNQNMRQSMETDLTERLNRVRKTTNRIENYCAGNEISPPESP